MFILKTFDVCFKSSLQKPSSLKALYVFPKVLCRISANWTYQNHPAVSNHFLLMNKKWYLNSTFLFKKWVVNDELYTKEEQPLMAATTLSTNSNFLTDNQVRYFIHVLLTYTAVLSQPTTPQNKSANGRERVWWRKNTFCRNKKE